MRNWRLLLTGAALVWGTGLQAQPLNLSALAREVAQLRADSQVQDENSRRLLAMLETLRQENSQLKQDLVQLQREMAQLRSARQGQSTQLLELTHALEVERQARQQMTSAVVETVSREVARLMERAAPVPRASEGGASQGDYTVQSGDTLSAIATAFRVSVPRLKEINQLKSDVIRVGQKLTIPAR
jgi:nucleoid-associated protein YgaU